MLRCMAARVFVRRVGGRSAGGGGGGWAEEWLEEVGGWGLLYGYDG